MRQERATAANHSLPAPSYPPGTPPFLNLPFFLSENSCP